MKMRIGFAGLAVLTALLVAGCVDLATTARDAIAGNYGYIVYAQGQYGTQCKANPAASPACGLVNKDIAANNTAIDMLEAYCSGTPAAGQQAFSAGGPCVPVKTAAAALQAAIAGINQVLADLRPLVNVGSAPAKPAGTASLPANSHALAEAYRL